MEWKQVLSGICLIALLMAGQTCLAQAIPPTPGQTLTGKRIVLAEAARGQVTILVAGFSRKGGDGCGAWVDALEKDPALARAATYQIAMLEAAPSLLRGMIVSGIRKGLAPARQERFVVLTADEKQWRSYFAVTVDSEPYVVLIDATGRVLWHGRGAAANLEPLLRAARR
jgi:hypothetical protein